MRSPSKGWSTSALSKVITMKILQKKLILTMTIFPTTNKMKCPIIALKRSKISRKGKATEHFTDLGKLNFLIVVRF